MNDGQDKSKPPAIQANHPEASPINGMVPPVETRWRPGQSGNPKGRPSAGLSVVEWFNSLADCADEDELERIARNRKQPVNKRAAAMQWLDIMSGAADLSDFAGFTRGTETLESLKARGVSVRAIKKVRETEREGETRREIELSERGGASLDRIMDRTAGKPQQSVDVTSGGESIRPILVAPGQLNLVDWQQQVVQIQQGTPDKPAIADQDTGESLKPVDKPKSLPDRT